MSEDYTTEKLELARCRERVKELEAANLDKLNQIKSDGDVIEYLKARVKELEEIIGTAADLLNGGDEDEAYRILIESLALQQKEGK